LLNSLIVTAISGALIRSVTSFITSELLDKCPTVQAIAENTIKINWLKMWRKRSYAREVEYFSVREVATFGPKKLKSNLNIDMPLRNLSTTISPTVKAVKRLLRITVDR